MAGDVLGRNRQTIKQLLMLKKFGMYNNCLPKLAPITYKSTALPRCQCLPRYFMMVRDHGHRLIEYNHTTRESVRIRFQMSKEVYIMTGVTRRCFGAIICD